MVDEKPLEAMEEELVLLVGALMVPLVDTALLMFEELEVVGAVRFGVGMLLVPFPYGAPLLLMLEGNPVEARDEVEFTVLEGIITVLLVVLKAVKDTPVGPTELVRLVPLPYGAPLME